MTFGLIRCAGRGIGIIPRVENDQLQQNKLGGLPAVWRNWREKTRSWKSLDALPTIPVMAENLEVLDSPRAYRETSLLLECLTPTHGRVGLIARGVRRERSRLPRGLLQPLQPLLLAWTGRGELATMTRAEASAAPFPLESGQSPAFS